MTLGKYIRKRRKEMGLSQWDVSEELGLSSPQFISNIERELAQVPLNYIPILYHFLKLDKKIVKDLLMKNYKEKVSALFK